MMMIRKESTNSKDFTGLAKNHPLIFFGALAIEPFKHSTDKIASCSRHIQKDKPKSPKHDEFLSSHNTPTPTAKFSS